MKSIKTRGAVKRLVAAAASIGLIAGVQMTAVASAQAAGPGVSPATTTEFTPGTPVVDGVAKVGTVLVVFAGSWSPTPDSYTHQWLRDGSAISGATASTYFLVSADLGHKISVRVTGHRTGYSDASATSAQTDAVVKGSEAALTKAAATARVIRTGTCVTIPLRADYLLPSDLAESVSKVSLSGTVKNAKGKKIGVVSLTSTATALSGTARGSFRWCTRNGLGKVSFVGITGTWTGVAIVPARLNIPASGEFAAPRNAVASVQAGVGFASKRITHVGTRRTFASILKVYQPGTKKWVALGAGRKITVEKKVGSRWVKVTTVKTSAGGKIAAHWNAAKNATYRLNWAGTSTAKSHHSTGVRG